MKWTLSGGKIDTADQELTSPEGEISPKAESEGEEVKVAPSEKPDKTMDDEWVSLEAADVLEYQKLDQEEAIKFPMFFVHWAQNDLIYLGGGGGGAGRGVASAGVVCEYQRGTKGAPSWPKTIGKFDSRDRIVYGCSFHPSQRCAAFAIGDKTFLFAVAPDGRLAQSGCFQTDFHENVADRYQAVTQFSVSGVWFITGGFDKTLRLWKYPSHEKMVELGKHKDDLTSASFDGKGTMVATASGEKLCRIFRIPTPAEFESLSRSPTSSASSSASSPASFLVKELTLIDDKTKKPLEFRSCKFCLSSTSPPNGNATPAKSSDDSKSALLPTAKAKASSSNAPSSVSPKSPPLVDYLLTAMNASARGPGYLAQWDPITWTVLRKIKVDAAPVVCMEVSNNGRLVAVATNRSSIYIFRTDTLRVVMARHECHDLVVTGMSFRRDDSELVSVSADRSWAFTHIRAKGSHTWVILLLFALLAAVVAAVLQQQPQYVHQLRALLPVKWP